MPRRKIVLTTDEIYHVATRSIAQVPIFEQTRDYLRALEAIDYYRYTNTSISFSHYKRLQKEVKEAFIKNLRKHKTLINILSFCLMPNHCHLLLKQNQDEGISTFMSNYQNSYAKYFNTKYKRVGGLFQSMFKAVRIETDEQLLHVSRYIHLNPASAYLIEIEQLKTYPWSSFPEYLNEQGREFVDTELTLSLFKTRDDYKKFVFDQADYQRELQTIKHLLLEK